MRPLDRAMRKFAEIPRSAYVRKLRPLWLKDYQPPWFFNADCDERQVLISAGLMYRAGDYVLMPSLLWLCQIDQTELAHTSLAECIQQTSGFRFNLWYGRAHPDFMSLPILAGSPDPTRLESPMTTTTEITSMCNGAMIASMISANSCTTASETQVSLANSSIKPMCTFLDLERHEIDHLTHVEQCVRRWLITIGHWSSPSSESISSFFHIPPPDSPKNTLHLHLVAGKELELEYNHVFYRVPLSALQAGEQPSFIVDLTRWRNEQRLTLADLGIELAGIPRVYGITGCTGSGKSKLTVDLSKKYDAEVVHQDDFLLPDEQLPKLSENELSSLPTRWTQKKNIDRSHPLAVDWQKMIDHIESLKSTTSKRFILVEGNLLLSRPNVRDMLDRVLFINVPECKKEIIMRRRMTRARPGCLSEIQIGVTEEEYLPFFNSVWHKYQLYGQPCFQAHHLDFEMPTEDAISHMAPWFVNGIDYELTKCQNQLNLSRHPA